MQYVAAFLIAIVALVGGTWAFFEVVTKLIEQQEQIGVQGREAQSLGDKYNPGHHAIGHQVSGEPAAAGQFDIAKIAPNGTSVFAGRAMPNSVVTVLADGEPIGTVNSDLNGEWVLITERRVPNSNPKLSIQLGTAPVQQHIEAASSEIATASSTPPSVASVTAQLMDDLQRRVDRARANAEERVGRSADVAGEPGETNAAADGDKSVSGRDVAAAVPEQAAANRAEPRILPVPIKFVFREAVFTEDGRKAAQLLLEYVRLEKLPLLRLTGHADERGTHDFNMNLSAERLATVAQLLRAGGYSGNLELYPRVMLNPLVDRSSLHLPRDQLERRPPRAGCTSRTSASL